MPSSDLSPFPAGYCGVELYYSDAWQDITADVDQTGMRIQHGVRSEGGTADASSLSFRVRNPEGKYSPRNPSSPLYGLIGRNTPVRCWVDLGLPWVDLDGTINARVTTPDSTQLSITGDIDLRWDGYRDDWHLAADLMSKVDSSSQVSYALWCFGDGMPGLYWSTDGTAGAAVFAYATVPLPAHAGRIAIRATLDVNNGAGGWTARFYTSDSIAGTWTQLGDDVTGTGTTSIFDSTSSVTIGQNPASLGETVSPPQRIYGWQIRNSIGGTVVSGVDTSTKTVGASTLSDGIRTWTLRTGSSITRRHHLFTGEVSEWPMSWNTKGSPSVMSDVTAAGVIRRLGQGVSPLDSPWRRGVMALSTVRAYWPMEDAAGSARFGPAVGTFPMKWGSGSPSLAAFSGFDASLPVPTIGSATLIGSVGPAYTPTGVQVRGLWNIPSTTPNNTVLLRVLCNSSTVARVDLIYLTTGGLQVKVYDQGGVEKFTNSAAMGIDNTDALLSVELSDNGTGTTVAAVRLRPGDPSGVFMSGTYASSQLGRVTAVIVNPDGAALGGLAVGHISVEDTVTDIFALIGQLDGFTGEEADVRVYRLATEATGAASVRGATGASTLMSKQGTDAFLTLLRDAEAADGGIMHDDRAQLGIRYRSLESMYSQPPAVTIAYTDNLVIPMDPLDDDARTRNRVTVTRDRGSSSTVEETEGPLSIADAPAGVGVYDESLTLKVYDDSRLEDLAGWRVHLGTANEPRFPVLGVDLAHPTFLNDPLALRDLLTAWIGDRVVITDPPAWLPPDDIDQIIVGVSIDMTPLHLRIRWACVPARPYRAARYGAATDRWSGSGTVTSATLTTTATSMAVTLPADVEWTAADGPYDVMVSGERMTVTNVVPRTNEITNPSFETDTAGWLGGTSATIARVTTEKYWGTASLQVTCPVAGGYAQFTPRVLDADASETWTLSCWVKGTAGASFKLEARGQDGSGVTTNTGSTTVTLTGSWQQVSVTVTYAAGTTQMWPLFFGSTAGVVFYLDAVMATESTDLLPYFEGSGSGAQTMTVTRSVNGVVKTHAAGESVALADPCYYGLLGG